MQGEYQFEPPPNVPGGAMIIADVNWHACTSCGEEILPDEVTRLIEAERNRRHGLLTPDEIRRIRRKTGLSATEMAHVLGVGEKSCTRWENGRSVQNRSNDTLIRLLDNHSESFAIVDAERSPDREELISGYFANLSNEKGQRQYAMAAHGGDLGIANTEKIRKRLNEIRSVHGKNA
jgi:putative zinc finger/helix-turn-helix YgiT family protein